MFIGFLICLHGAPFIFVLGWESDVTRVGSILTASRGGCLNDREDCMISLTDI